MAGVNIPSETVEQWARALEELAAQMRSFITTPPPPPSPPLPSISVFLTPAAIQAGETAELSWASADAISVVLNGTAVDLNGRMVVQPTESVSYLFSVTGLGGTVTKTVTLAVNPVEPPPPPPTTSGVTFNLTESPPYNSLYVGPYDPVTGLPSKAFDIEHGVAYFLTAPNVWRVRDGYWNDPSVWNTGTVPQAGDNVAVTHLTFDLAGDRTLRVKTVAVNVTGTVTIGTPQSPVPLSRKIVISLVDGDYEPNDPQKFSRGLLSTGKISVHAVKQPTERAHASGALLAGMTTFSVMENVQHWSVGDKVVFADTRRLVSKDSSAKNPGLPFEAGFTSATEVRTITAVSDDGFTFTVDQPLSFDHQAQLDDLGEIQFWPVIGHLSRDVVVRSETHLKHHVMWGHSCELDAAGIEFFNTGVTTAAPLDAGNVKGRYACHFHMYHGATPPVLRYYSIWSDVPDNPAKWALTVHSTHYGRFEHGCVYNWSGWGIGEEIGNEWKNRYTSNFVCSIRTGGPGSPQYTSYGTDRGYGDLGWNGSAYWFRGSAQIVRDCEFADSIVGFNLWLHGLKQVQTGPEGDYEPRLLPLDWLNFGGGGGRTAYSFEAWHHGMRADIMVPDDRAAESVLKGFYGYAAWAKIYYNYITNRFTFIDPLLINARHGMDGTDYATHNFRVVGLRAYNVDEPLRPSTLGSQVYEDCFFGGAQTVLISSLRWGVHEDPPTPRVITYRNCKTRNCKMVLERNGTGGIGSGSVNLRALDRLVVEDFEGVPGDNFEVYIREQHPDDWPMPVDVPQFTYLIGSPEPGVATPEWQAHYDALHAPFEIKPGLTNKELLAKYGFCWAGKLLPQNTTTRPGVVGLVGAA